MEKRYETRQTVRVRVVVHDRHGRRGTFETRDATSAGMFIETGGLGAAIGEVVWIENLEAATGHWPTPLPAVVVHRAGGGVGILLSQPVPKVLFQADQVATRA
jgi:hypothetical protein